MNSDGLTRSVFPVTRTTFRVVCCWIAVTSGGFVERSLAQTQSDKTSTNQPPTRNITVRPVSPVDYFRELLAMSPAQLERALADKPAEKKQALLSKIQEYKSMTADERELRLRVTAVRWYLVPLMKLSPVERLRSLSSIPPAEREMVSKRLKLWDEIPPQLQREFLKNEAIIDDLLRLEASSPTQREAFLKTFPPERREKLEHQLAQWRTLPTGQRQQMYDRFNKFFELDEEEREKTLGIFSPVERQQMEQALQQFEKLPAGQRKRCMESFRKFASMTPDEQSQFLKNAERWQSMTPSERQAWRDIVQKTPPLPPIPSSRLPRILPPLPPTPSGPPTATVVGTNVSAR